MIGLTGILWIPLLSLLLYKLDYTKLIRKKKMGKIENIMRMSLDDISKQIVEGIKRGHNMRVSLHGEKLLVEVQNFKPGYLNVYCLNTNQVDRTKFDLKKPTSYELKLTEDIKKDLLDRAKLYDKYRT